MGRALLIALYATLGMSFAAEAHPKQNLERVKAIAATLRAEPGFAEMRISNRTAWDALAKDPGAAGVIRSAESIAATPIEPLDDSIYTNQDVEVWGPISGRRCRSILPLAFAECLENKGRFLPSLIARLDAIAAQTTWMNPYHDRPRFGNFFGTYSTVDLNVSEFALDVALVLDVLKGKIPEATVRKLTLHVWRRCYETYLHTAEDRNSDVYPRLGWFFGDSNWNPACHYQSVGSALLLIPDRETRAKFVEAAERAVPSYLNGLSAEGYCQEGLDYWNYGFGQYLKLGLIVRLATDGKVDLFAFDRARRGCLYAHEFMLATDCAPQFGDGTASVASKSNLAKCELVWPETVCSATDRVTATGNGLEHCLLTAFGNRPPRPAQTAPYRLPIRTVFTDAQIYIGRSASPGPASLACCIKGGHNGVPHNHNDAGQYIIALGGTQMVQDPSGRKYDFDTFGPKRYHSPMLNSYGHAVPYPAGLLQNPGREFGAQILSTDFTDARDVFELDLRGAYPADANLKTLTRRLTYDRANASVELVDHVTFAAPSSFESPVSTFGKVEKGAREDAFTIVRETREGVKRLDFAVDCGGAKWHVKEEKIPNPGRTEPTRFAIVLDEPATEATVTLRFTPGEIHVK